MTLITDPRRAWTELAGRSSSRRRWATADRYQPSSLLGPVWSASRNGLKDCRSGLGWAIHLLRVELPALVTTRPLCWHEGGTSLAQLAWQRFPAVRARAYPAGELGS